MGLINRRTVRIEWGDCDPAGIVWYPRYFGMFDAATAGLLEAAGFPKPAMLARFEVVGYPTVDTRAKFLKPSKFGEDIVIETTIPAFKRSSFEVLHRVFKGDILAIEGFETRVLVKRDPATGGITSCPVPQEIVDALMN
ncbi:MAG: acyl-CoA thioesterase [Rhizobiales bacterium]|nr:acyl-CoA thioesterase [Hyphomicrobiales bacterium]